jgi:hypothetical protein
MAIANELIAREGPAPAQPTTEANEPATTVAPEVTA